MILGSKARYAVMAMADLASRPENRPVTLAELAQTQEIPLPYLEQIFAQLRRADLVQSARGPKGGYALARDAGSITIAEIVLAADESLKMTRCEKHAQNGCLSNKARCLTHDLWDGLGEHIHEYLDSITLLSLTAGSGRAHHSSQALPI